MQEVGILKKADRIAGPERLNSKLIASKWANGFDVTNDIKYMLDSNLCTGIEKIRSMSFLANHYTKQMEDDNENDVIFPF